jgi:SEC-C motif domain protein
MASSLHALCPCGSQKLLAVCCTQYWQGEAPPTAELLMRARYSAFALGQLDFLLATLHPASHQSDELAQLQISQSKTQWLKLHVLAATDCEVEFLAFFNQQGVLGQLHERSHFVFERGRWWYVDGEFLPPVKWQRNAPCWCGAAEKYKKCHGA